MNNRNFEKVVIRSFTDSVDEYGEVNTDSYTDTEYEMMLSYYSQKPTQDIIYNDVSLLALTPLNIFSDKNQLIYNNETYLIKHIIPSDRLIQLLCKKV